MPSSRSATHQAGHGSDRNAASTAKTGTSSALDPRAWRAPVPSTISLGADQRGSDAQFVDGPERVGYAVREPRRHLDERQIRCFSAPTETLSCSAIRQRTAISCDRGRPLEHPVSMAIISALQMRRHHIEHAVITRRTTPCFECIESDGIVGNFSVRQQQPRSWAYNTIRCPGEAKRFARPRCSGSRVCLS